MSEQSTDYIAPICADLCFQDFPPVLQCPVERPMQNFCVSSLKSFIKSSISLNCLQVFGMPSPGKVVCKHLNHLRHAKPSILIPKVTVMELSLLNALMISADPGTMAVNTWMAGCCPDGLSWCSNYDSPFLIRSAKFGSHNIFAKCRYVVKLTARNSLRVIGSKISCVPHIL